MVVRGAFLFVCFGANITHAIFVKWLGSNFKAGLLMSSRRIMIREVQGDGWNCSVGNERAGNQRRWRRAVRRLISSTSDACLFSKC